MKVTFKNNNNNNTCYIKLPIEFEHEPEQEYQKHEVISFKLRSMPNNDHSPLYEFTVPKFSLGMPEECLIFIKNLQQVIVGLNGTTGPLQYPLVRHLLQGDALAAFNATATNIGNETTVNFKECLK